MFRGIVHALMRVPVIRQVLPPILRLATRPQFGSTEAYWVRRYATGGDSGCGSSGALAQYKADFVNRLVRKESLDSVIDFGCGDGRQLSLASYPRYLGFDVSPDALAQCATRFADDPTKAFRMMRDYRGEHADLALSMDVIYHLVEDEVYERYMERLFGAADRFVVIYSTNRSDQAGVMVAHIRHRRFTEWVSEHAPEWRLVKNERNPYAIGPDELRSDAEFTVFEKRAAEAADRM